MIVKRRAQAAGLINGQQLRTILNILSGESRNSEDRWIPIFIGMETNIRDIYQDKALFLSCQFFPDGITSSQRVPEGVVFRQRAHAVNKGFDFSQVRPVAGGAVI